MDCTSCLDCLHACPHDNVGIQGRLPAAELWEDPWRSGLGRLSRRPDIAALVAVFAFGAILNAFAMVSPVYALEAWLSGFLGTRSEVLVLGLLFLLGLVLVPLLFVYVTGWLSRWAAGERSRSPLLDWIVAYSYALVPVGLGIWLAHYLFHFLTGFWTFVPVVQSFVSDVAGRALLGTPRWEMGPLLPPGWLFPMELGFLGLGWFGSLLAAHQISARVSGRAPLQAFVPWAALITLLFAAAIWLMGQPMEMRGTFLAG